VLNWNEAIVLCLRELHFKWDVGCGLIVEGASVELV
jgi:hypothetical protein